MANSLGDSSRERQDSNRVFAEVPVPTFDPVTPEGRRARWALLISSLVTLLCLIAAIISEHYLKEWRACQRQFEELLVSRARTEGKSVPTFPQEIKQITVPSYGVADRCTTCHLGIDDPAMAEAAQPFRSHPAWVLDIHPIESFGCTPCHGGQGLATTTADAHGTVPHWEDPLIPSGYYEAGCGSCHTHLKADAAGQADYGRRLFERYDCFACHQINGRGRGTGPDLSLIGAKRPRPEWHDRHLALQRGEGGQTWWQSYGPIEAAEIDAIDSFLDQLVGAPALVRAKSITYGKGCPGCHRINGVGGDDGPDLSGSGRKSPAALDYSSVEGIHNLAGWQKAHLRAPARIVAGSQMPQPILSEGELDAVTLYLVSLRGTEQPMSTWPTDRLEADKLGVRDYATNGESLYTAFCSACHGKDGLGMRFGISIQAFPAVAHPEFLAVASDRFIRQTLQAGRPGRRMPAWGTKEGGLRTEELNAVISHLRSQKPLAPSWDAVSGETPDPALGARLYGNACSPCHGKDGEGAIGPALSQQPFLATVEPYFLYRMLVDGREDTAMGSYRRYTALEAASIVDYMGKWRKDSRLETPSLPTERSIVAGERVFGTSCAPCHGERGEGRLASNLVNSALQEAASDGFMAAAVRYGRCVPPEDAPEGIWAPTVTDQELADAIEYLRKRLSKLQPRAGGRPARGDVTNGRNLFAKTCAGCHGEKGRGGVAPELASSEFQKAATDGYLQATIIRGRPSAGMPALGSDNPGYRRLTADEIGDIVTYLRTLGADA